MYADIVDYEEYRSGRRPTGLIFSSSSMSQKLGWALGGAVTGWLLAAFGYDQSAAVQSGEAIAGVRLMMSWFPAAGCLLAAAAVLFYPLGEKRMERITTGTQPPSENERMMEKMLVQWREELSEELTCDILPFWMAFLGDGVHFAGRIDGRGKAHPEAGKGAVLIARMLWTFSAAYRMTRTA